MLKIKDSIDLNILKDFGFSYNNGWQTGWKHPNFSICQNRKIRVHNGGNWNRNDVLFDLIQAGLVEKIIKEDK